MNRFFSIVLCVLLSGASLFAQEDKKDVRRGNKDYRKSNFKEAEIDYRKALLKDSTSFAATYDLANALYSQKDYEGAANTLEKLSKSAPESQYADRYFFNKGNVSLQKKDYQTGGSTALLDAIGDAIHHIGNVHKYARKEDRPDKTVFVIITDGMENASRRYTYEKVRGLIERRKEKYGWEFLFLGANIDAVAVASRVGISADRAVEYNCDDIGVELNYSTVSEAVSCMRTAGSIQPDWAAPIARDRKTRKQKR